MTAGRGNEPISAQLGGQAAPDAAPPRALSAEPSATGEVLPRSFGKYMLMRKLAAGGMAELFLALHRSVAGFEKLLVIKRILPQMNQDQQFIDMLLHEARIAATLSHPNIVQTFDVGQVDGTYFIAMEHIHGEDIRSIVRQMKKKDVAEFPIEHALTIVIGLCAGLAYAHEKRDLDGKLLGIVHRDISPQNIVVTFSGDVKIVDFGVAKSLHAGEESKGGHLKGKVPYMSPEQAAGEDIDHRSDIFAAGVVLFELTTGKRLFKGASEYETLRLICDSEYPFPSDVVANYPAELERIVMRALARNRDARYNSARDFQADLEAFVRQERLPVSTVSTLAWMEKLFAEKLDEQKADLQDIKQMADQLPPSPESDFSPYLTGTHPRFDHTGATSSSSSNTIVPSGGKSSKSGLILGGLALAVALGGIGFIVFGRPPVPTAPTEGVAQATAAAPAPEPKPIRGSLVLETDPPGASIWLGGDLHSEKTPATIANLPVDSDLQIKLTLDGFESHKETVRLGADGETKTLSVKLVAGSVSVLLEVEPEPQVSVDGKNWTGSPTKITGLSADEEHKIVVGLPGYVPKLFTFTGKNGETKTFKHVLVKGSDAAPVASEPVKVVPTGTGTVRVNAKGGGFCNVSINGAAYGPTPVVATVSAGNVKVSCKPEGGAAQAQAFKLEPGGSQRVTFSLP